MTIDIQPLTTAIGAEVRGVDLCGPLDESTVASVRAVSGLFWLTTSRSVRLSHPNNASASPIAQKLLCCLPIRPVSLSFNSGRPIKTQTGSSR